MIAYTHDAIREHMMNPAAFPPRKVEAPARCEISVEDLIGDEPENKQVEGRNLWD